MRICHIWIASMASDFGKFVGGCKSPGRTSYRSSHDASPKANLQGQKK